MLAFTIFISDIVNEMHRDEYPYIINDELYSDAGLSGDNMDETALNFYRLMFYYINNNRGFNNRKEALRYYVDSIFKANKFLVMQSENATKLVICNTGGDLRHNIHHVYMCSVHGVS